jgi:hypothetical protein
MEVAFSKTAIFPFALRMRGGGLGAGHPIKALSVGRPWEEAVPVFEVAERGYGRRRASDAWLPICTSCSAGA